MKRINYKKVFSCEASLTQQARLSGGIDAWIQKWRDLSHEAFWAAYNGSVKHSNLTETEYLIAFRRVFNIDPRTLHPVTVEAVKHVDFTESELYATTEEQIMSGAPDTQAIYDIVYEPVDTADLLRVDKDTPPSAKKLLLTNQLDPADNGIYWMPDELTVDGEQLVAGERYGFCDLNPDQENGIYIVSETSDIQEPK